jgi:hypothetical protein
MMALIGGRLVRWRRWCEARHEEVRSQCRASVECQGARGAGEVVVQVRAQSCVIGGVG